MYAIVEIGGTQFKVYPDSTLRIPKVDADVGKKITIEKVLLFSEGGKVEVGKPYIKDKSISAEVLRHGKERKVIVFKKKRRKNYRRKRGHRQEFTEIVVSGFAGSKK
jgi:large subunit ribosomal protein L21